jgi:anionic cell wall polymer biosynthesis LytR-Cps2A-Psr (LCP) family protein
MCYVRFRKDKGGDFVRTERQRQFLIAFKSQIVKNWMNLPEIIEQGVKVLGSSVQAKEVAALATFAKSVPQTNITMTRMPTKRGKGSFEEIDDSKAKKMFDTYGFNGREHEPKESDQYSRGTTKRAKEQSDRKKQELG